MVREIAVATAVAAVVLLLTSRRDRAPAGPVYVTSRSPIAGLGILLAGAAAFIYARKHQVPAATPAPQPAAATHTITQTITRYVPVHNWPVSGFELTLLGLAVITAAVLIVRLAGRYFGR